jgi:pSer/pThr/pTyr-binding forkhead associated (FHA) protein
MEPYVSGTLAGTGSFRCDTCGYVLTLAAADRLSDCPGCGGDSFSRASLFSAPTAEAAPAFTDADRDDWLREARTHIDEPGEYLAYEDGDRTVVVALTREWTRIGRSLAANVRFDDPTVSRRHALIVRQPDGVRVLDDRSLNGVFVNDRRVEWSKLEDGDEIVVGRHRLHFLVVAETLAEAGKHAAATS